MTCAYFSDGLVQPPTFSTFILEFIFDRSYGVFFTWGSEDETIPPMVAFQQLMQATDMTGSVSWCGQTPKMMVKQKPLEDWLVSWLVGWLVDSLIGCLLGWLVGWLVVVQSYTFCNLGCL